MDDCYARGKLQNKRERELRLRDAYIECLNRACEEPMMRIIEERIAVGDDQEQAERRVSHQGVWEVSKEA